ncbi:MAG: alcohol dehydrogenase catalytic domain-containing protein [bacterium]
MSSMPLSRAPAADALMRGHVLVRPGTIEFRELPRPRPEPGGVVVRVRAALTCGTDLKAYLRGHPKFPMPTLFGHEFAGEIAELGLGVRGVRDGDAVMAAPTAPCGDCYHCVRDQENLCEQVMATMVHGAYAEYVNLPASIVRTNLYAKPAALPFAEAALMEPLACVLHGLSRLRIRPDDTVVVIGAGAIGLLHLLVLRARGVERLVVVARNPARAALARALGASAILAVDAAATPDLVMDATAGRGADVVVECTGQVPVWEAALPLARRGGHVVLFGGCAAGTAVRFDTGRLHYDQVEISSPFHFAPRDVRAAYELLGSGDFGGAALIAGAYPLEGLGEALARHRSGDGPKFAIVPAGV